MLTRKHYPKIIYTEFQQLDFEIQMLRREIEIGDNAKVAEYEELIPVLKRKLHQAQKKLSALANARENEWDALKADLDNTREALKEMWSFAVSKIQPRDSSVTSTLS